IVTPASISCVRLDGLESSTPISRPLRLANCLSNPSPASRGGAIVYEHIRPEGRVLRAHDALSRFSPARRTARGVAADFQNAHSAAPQSARRCESGVRVGVWSVEQ